MEATKVGMREFRSGLAEFIAAEAPVAVTRHGQTVGFFIPTKGQPCLLYTSPSPRDRTRSRMPSSA